MRRINIALISLLSLASIGTGCKLERFPETEFSDVNFWNTEIDLINACNRMYQELPGFGIDNRADDNVGPGSNQVSTGSRPVPSTSGDWTDPYRRIFTANNILEKGGKANVSEAIKNRYFAEARFFRAYNYFSLLQKYGDVPLLLKTLDLNSPELSMPRTPRATVAQAIYDDLDFAAQWLPTATALPAAQFGRVTKSAALAFKARVALYEGTRAKFHASGDWQSHLNKAIDAATQVMGLGHSLNPSYPNQFLIAGEGPTNKENIFVKIYGPSAANVLLAHNNSRDLENGRIAPTRSLLRQYLYTDGLPAWTTENLASATKSTLFIPESNEAAYDDIFKNRDPRLKMTLFVIGEQAYQRPWVPVTSLGSRTAFAGKKGFSLADNAINNQATVDKVLIRYAEVLLIYAEAKYELNGSISDADLNLSINALRSRVGFNVALTNAFVTANNLDMRQEIRRERSVELALENFRYDDLIRWKTAEIVLPQEILGSKFNT
ncbi:MAG: RagB/SusD family nutrient uptake outer membrane protein, partial [Pedobacter sp.]